MKLVTTVRLHPDDSQALLFLMERFNRACNALSQRAFDSRTFHWLDLQRAAYHWLRAEFGLCSAEAVVAVRKVAYAYADTNRRDRVARFALRGAIPVYRHSYKRGGMLSFYGQRILFTARADYPLSGKHEARLVFRGGRFVLYQVYEQPEGEAQKVSDWLGCDLGIINLLADSDGQIYSGARIDQTRRKYAHRRRNLQRNGTRSARRKLRRIAGRQARFQRDTNHVISKRVVAKAQDTRRGIALEDLKGIRERITVAGRRQRARHANWAFGQLGQFIAYKAALVGIPTVAIDARYTSQTCPQCGHVAKANRPSQSRFECVSCGLAGAADTIAARNIRARARGDAPMVAVQASDKSLS